MSNQLPREPQRDFEQTGLFTSQDRPAPPCVFENAVAIPHPNIQMKKSFFFYVRRIQDNFFILLK
jgi:hypothetical protein